MKLLLILTAILLISGCYKCGDATGTYSIHCTNYPRPAQEENDCTPGQMKQYHYYCVYKHPK